MRHALTCGVGAWICCSLLLTVWTVISRRQLPEQAMQATGMQLGISTSAREDPHTGRDAKTTTHTDFRTHVLRRFDQSNISTFLSTYHHVSRTQPKRMVVGCFVQPWLDCGGVADRVLGLPIAVSLAFIMRRQLVLHPTFLARMPDPPDFNATHFHAIFRDYGGQRVSDQVRKVLKDRADTLFVTISSPHRFVELTEVLKEAFDGSRKQAWRRLLKYNNEMRIVVDKIQQECVPQVLCGAALVHRIDALREGIDAARQIAEAMTMLPEHNYTAIHVRTGGSTIRAAGGSCSMPTLFHTDGHGGDDAQMWLDVAERHAPRTSCSGHIALITDSARFLAEMRFRVRDKVMLTHCCSQAVHWDKPNARTTGFFSQEVLDLFLMARSRRIVATQRGRFALLGSIWLGRPGPTLDYVTNQHEIARAFNETLATAGCST